MSLKVSEKKIYILIVSISYMVFYNLVLAMFFSQDYHTWMRLFAIIVIVSYIYDVFVMSMEKIKILSLCFFFITLSYVFHFGQVFLNAFFPNYTYVTSNFLSGDINITKQALVFCLNVIQIVTIGIVWFQKNRIKEKHSLLHFNDINVAQMKFMGWVICLITVPLKIGYTIAAIELVQNDTYLLSVVEGYSGVYIQFTNFCIIGFVLLLLAYADNLLKANCIICAEILFLLWTMMSGGRIYAVVSLIIICYCYFTKVNQIKLGSFIVIAIIGLVFLQLLTVITALRTTNDFNISAIIEEMLNPSNNFILSLLDEFGATQYTVIMTVTEVPELIEYHMGQSYIKAWALAGINIGGALEEIKREVQYTSLLNHQYAYGGSYIGELFYNFGYWSYGVAIFIGMLVVKLSNSIEYYLRNREYVNFIMLVMPMLATLQWVRGYFDGFSRNTVWGAIFIAVLYAVASRIKVIRER